MDTILNITNGDCTVKLMAAAGIPGVILPWRDVLHDGPVPAGLSLEQLSAVRAKCNYQQLCRTRPTIACLSKLCQNHLMV